MAPSHELSQLTPERILVRSVNWLGDAVMTTPALARLRERFPAAHIALLTPAKLKELWLHHPAIDETIAIDPAQSIWAVGRRVRPLKWDLALILPNSPRSAMESWWGRIPRRIGYARPWRNFFLTDAIPGRKHAIRMHKRSAGEVRQLIREEVSGPAASVPVLNPAAHQVSDYLHLVGCLGAGTQVTPPHVAVIEEEIQAVRKRWALADETLLLGLNPGAEYGPAKRWPAERFAAAAREIRSRTNCTWLIFGGKGDATLASEIQSAIGGPDSSVLNLAGKTSLRELCALLKLCRAVLTNDTGPMHVAAAVGTPVVVPFGSTSPILTGPGLPGDSRHQFITSSASCSPCFLRECPIDFRCMKGITSEHVVESVCRTLANEPGVVR
jgi:heptosyltransferase-2